MHGSDLVQVWVGSKSLHNLKTLDLNRSYSLQKSPDFSQVPNLEELILNGCGMLSEIHPSIGHLKRLSLVNLRDCYQLISLPRDFYESKSVKTLLLNGCSKFREVHEDIGEMISLRILEAKETAIWQVPPSILRLKNLTHLSLHRISIKLKGKYKYLSWEGCPLESIPDDIFNQDKLVVLEMQESKLVQVWEGSKLLHNLKTLDLSHSSSLQKSPDFSQVPNLEELILTACISLSEIHPSIGHLKGLSLVNLTHCWELIGCSKFREVHEDIGEMISLRTLEANGTVIRPPSIVKLKNLTRLSLKYFRSIHLPHLLHGLNSSIGHLKRLSLVNLTGCDNLISLPRDFYKLKSVETLLLNDCSKFIELHEDIGEMISLRTLEAEHTAIREVPPSILRLKNLTRLSLSGVKSIHLPHSLHGLNSLRELNLSWCKLADDAIPKDLGSLISLQDLNLQGNDFHTLPSLSSLSKLETLRLYECFNLRTIPDIPPNVKVQSLIYHQMGKFSMINILRSMRAMLCRQRRLGGATI